MTTTARAAHAAHAAHAALTSLWHGAGLPAAALAEITLTGADPVLPSSFAVGSALQASLGAAELAAAEIGWRRGGLAARQQVSVDMAHAALDSCGWFSLDGQVPDPWDKLSGLYACADQADGAGWVRLHANFAHHRDGALKLLGLPPGAATEREAVAAALRHWRAEAFQQAAAEAGLVATALRSFDEWDRHPQARAVAAQPLVAIERIGDAEPIGWPALLAPASHGARPLHGLRVLDLTRILAGPVAGRTLAAYGAEVMLLNAPHLPNIVSIADTSRGKLSAQLDLRGDAGRAALRRLIGDAHVFMQGYRPGALAALGFAPHELARLRPGIVCVSLSAYGDRGPWADRRGFDSLVQTATGFNHAEAQAAGSAQPKALPLQVLDYAAAYLLAFGTQAALLRQAGQGGSWHVQVSLAGVGHWLRGLGRVVDGFAVQRPPFEPYLEASESGFGRLVALRHAAQFSATPAGWALPSMPPGSHPAAWPA